MNALDCTLNVHTIAGKLAVSCIFRFSGKHPQFSEYLGCDGQNNFHNKQFQCRVHDSREAQASPLTSAELYLFTQIEELACDCQENQKSTKYGAFLTICEH